MCPAFYGEIPLTRWGILDDDGGYFYCITYSSILWSRWRGATWWRETSRLRFARSDEGEV